ncbi:hypothetical protein [Serinicoccus sediminis]|uniref:hypothetical protein n=1 Tax=Serinicoccus sediminis TaxID=2306021 RepID=UPI0010227D42|nr:hypothetical protein [Serinicoccus sediminis]
MRAVSLTTARREALLAEQAYEEGVRAAQNRLTRAGEDPLVQELDGWRLGRQTLRADVRERVLLPTTRFDLLISGTPVWIAQTVDASAEGEPPDRRVRPRLDDRRRVRLRVHDLTWQEELGVPAELLDEAERFVTSGRSVVGALARARTDRQRRITAALQELERARHDRRRLEVAWMTVEDLEGAWPLPPDLPLVTRREDGPDVPAEDPTRDG